jgi:hypothetical protein
MLHWLKNIGNTTYILKTQHHFLLLVMLVLMDVLSFDYMIYYVRYGSWLVLMMMICYSAMPYDSDMMHAMS